MTGGDEELEAVLDLRRGELVEVRSEEEILASLDEDGALDGLPFMPEMRRFCGSRLRVFRRADKTCDTISGQNLGRRMERCVHLEGTRCDGAAHGGCQAACLVFWKEAWLKRVESARDGPLWRLVVGSGDAAQAAGQGGFRSEDLDRLAVRCDPADASNPTYRCQITQLLEATAPLSWWEPGQYLRDWLSGNVALFPLLRAIVFRGFYLVVSKGPGFRVKRAFYNGLARLLGEVSWPYDSGTLSGRTPVEHLHLQPGELVQVKPHEEILATLKGKRNRGLSFAPEMVRYCGGTYRVRARAEKIIDEPTGKIMSLRSDCIILEDVVCQSECSSNRLFCPRSIFPYWREIWLRRVEEAGPSLAVGRSTPVSSG